MPNDARIKMWRGALVRGLAVATACVIAVAFAGAVWGGVFGYRPGAAIYGGAAPPGVGGAVAVATVWGVLVGPPAGLLGFVVGVIRGLKQS